jgi:hypothetical protein
VKRWRLTCLALALCVSAPAEAAEDWSSAARELARKTAAAVGKGDSVAVTWRNLSSLGPGALAQARDAFEGSLRDGGIRVSEVAPSAEAQITMSENATSGLLVEELRKADERSVWIASWNRTALAPPTGVSLEKRLLWEQADPILDIVPVGDSFLVLTPSALMRTAPRQSVPIVSTKPWPRDLRGRLRLNGNAVQVTLPGVLCEGSVDPSLMLACKPSDDPWTVESGSRGLLLASFAPNRNYFDGRVVTQTGARKTVAPFYSAAAVEEAGRTLWILSMLDGLTEIFDAAMDPAGSIRSWGSDIAGVDARCGGASIVLATRPGEGPDAIQAFAIASRAPVVMGPPVEFPGPVTALWPSGVAVIHESARGKFQAYAVSVACAP